ncbi:MAG: DEAD/DEAH box helicase [Deltaproteobacteria bacterium]|nr:DEAD/DEAH box helicase [Deltaproteobacteria bacterium]
MAVPQDPLSHFHPLVRDWFLECVGTPTQVQAQAWPLIAQGRHTLLTAPTGSGKTLTAFLWAIQQLLCGEWPTGAVRVLYISPLKALNYDIERNLAGPLRELQSRFQAAGEKLPEVRVQTRSGDTSSRERQRMIRRPPEILITTPESLNILLTSKNGRKILGGLATVILDEVHAVVGSKRGTHLMTAVDRLVPLSGEFQRVAISATIRPLERIAQWVGGYQLLNGGLHDAEGSAGDERYRQRAMAIVRARGQKDYRLRVNARPQPDDPQEALGAGRPGAPDDNLWTRLAAEFRQIIYSNRSTLFFANSRRMTEKITRFINEGQHRDLAYSHHGSLSREIRSVVEKRLKAGELPALVATNSLELGIDIGDLDEVVLIQTPPTVSSAVQRLGRAGHGVGQTSHGRLYPTHARDFLEAAVVARCVLDQDIEEMRPVECPLDVLAQVIVSMVAAEPWDIHRLYDALRTSYPYRRLPRRSFELVLEMLAGRYADSRLRELKPRISIDRVEGVVRARDGVARILYLGGGTIPDRGYFALRLADTQAKLGELDEEFVWERSIGDTFALGAQSWRIERITHNDVLVAPSSGGASLAPFWRADERDRDSHLSDRLGAFLARADGLLESEDFAQELTDRYCMSSAAARELLELLQQQKASTDCSLPHRQHLVVEHFADPFGGGRRPQLILQTFWGGKVNRPFAMALGQAWEERYGFSPELIQDNDCINLVLPEDGETAEVLSLVTAANLESLLRRGLEKTGFFGARFRHNAACALLLPRSDFRRRMPLWLSRLRSKKLLQSVRRYEDFPILMETWRTCLGDEFELDALRRRLDELQRGEIQVSHVFTTAPSPFAEGLIWKQTNKLMYEDDTPEDSEASRLRQDLLKELVFSSHLRPKLERGLVLRFEAKLQRLHPDYAPKPGNELLEWVKDRVLMPEKEWQALIAASKRDHPEAWNAPAEEVTDRLVTVQLPGAEAAVCAIERLPRVLKGLALKLDQIEVLPVSWPGDGEGSANLTATLTAARSANLDRAFAAWVAANPDQGGERGEPEGAADPALDLVAEWLRFYGPQYRAQLRGAFGLESGRLEEILQVLRAEGRIVVDRISRSATEVEVCDGENLEMLLRLLRAQARPTFEPLPIEDLPLFLARQQGLVEPGSGVEDLKQRLEKLLGFPAPAEAWESEILPARLEAYFPAWLDGLLAESGLLWLGCGQKRLTFAFESDLELHPVEDSEDSSSSEKGDGESPPLETVFQVSRGKFSFEDLTAQLSLSPTRLHDLLWQWAWQGEVTNDSFQVVRRGVENRFASPARVLSRSPGRGVASRRRGGSRWRVPRPFAGHWYRLERVEGIDDALDLEEVNKERARILLDRYGILFRELLQRELPALRWGRLFRALRLMELSGEILAGCFFAGISGLQFMPHATFRNLSKGLPREAVYWLGAPDPASVCGLDLAPLKAKFPARRRGNHLVFQGSRLVVTSFGNGRRLEIRPSARDPRIGEYLSFLKTLVSREVRPVKFVEIQEINGQPAVDSDYAEVLTKTFGATREPSGLRLRKRYSSGQSGEGP